jgi:hypothetical protein
MMSRLTFAHQKTTVLASLTSPLAAIVAAGVLLLGTPFLLLPGFRFMGESKVSTIDFLLFSDLRFPCRNFANESFALGRNFSANRRR